LIAGELYGDKKVALLALCLGSISPFFYLMSSTRLSHTTSAFFLALFMYLFLRTKRIDNVKWRMLFALLAGLSLGYAFNVRQLTALGYSLPFIIVMIIDLKRSPTKGFLTEVLFVIGFGIIFIFTLWYNALVTGNPLRFPYQYYNPMESLGFGVNGHTAVLAFRNLAVSITRLNSVLFGFPLSLLFVFIFLFAKKDFGDRLSLGILGGLAGSYMFFFCPGVSDVGPVYYYEMFIPLILLSARGILFLRDTLSQHFEHGKRFVYTFLILSCIAAVGTFIPERMTHIARLTKEIREPYETVQSANIHRALVMLQPFNYKGWVFSYRNPSPTFSDDIVYCRYADSVSNRTLINYFHDRSLYLLRYNANQAQYEMLPIERNTGRPLSLHP
jgi:4-amino-4-deoxy-L-arabinose transferase-like glycosyltransferase